MPIGDGVFGLDVAGRTDLASMPNPAQYPPFSPDWWVRVLCARLDLRQLDVLVHHDYYEGRHRLGFAGAKWRASFGHLFSHFADNWCQMVVDACAERLKVEGFRMTDDPASDADAWDVWQRNMLDNDSGLLHTEALATGNAYTIVWPDAAGVPVISIESPGQVVVARSAEQRRTVLAALKRWVDDFGNVQATLYLPNEVYKYQRQGSDLWAQREIKGEMWPLPNPLGVVPVVEFTNRDRIIGMWGISEITAVMPQQDAINKLLADMLVASEFSAFRQRWAIGLEVPEDPATHQPVEPFKSAVDRLWVSDSADTRFGEFSANDLNNYVAPIEMLVQHIAAQSATPPHYFYLRGQFPSGESIKSAETSLVAKCRNRMRGFSESWEQTMRLAFAVVGDARAKAYTAETIWGDPEFRSEGEHVDALVKLRSLDVPVVQLWEDAGYSPQQIARFKSMRAEDALLAGLNAPAPFGPPLNGRPQGAPGRGAPPPAQQPAA
jgi:hypothetical protein